MMKKSLYILLALFILVAVVIVATPASWVVYQLQRAAPNLQIAGVSGSAWKGELSGVQIISRGYAIALGQVTWQIQASSLLRMQPCATFTTSATAQSSRGKICVRPFSQELVVSEAYADVAASTIAALFAAEIQGSFTAAIDTIHVQQIKPGQPPNIKALVSDIIWQQAAFNNSEEWIALGELLITLSHDEQSGGIKSQWSDNAVDGKPGPVAIDLLGLLTPGPVTTINGTLRPRPHANQAMHQTLSLIGERNAAGAYLIDVKL